MSDARYFEKNVIPLLPSYLKVKEVSNDCYRIKNIETGQTIHYYAKAAKIFINFTERWKHNVENVFVKRIIIETLCHAQNKQIPIRKT